MLYYLPIVSIFMPGRPDGSRNHSYSVFEHVYLLKRKVFVLPPPILFPLALALLKFKRYE